MTTDVLDSRAISRDLFSATIGSICCCYTGQPFDTVKVRMQTNPDQFHGIFNTTGMILRNEGITAFWKGSVPTAAGMAMENCVAFGVNEGLKRAFPDDPSEFVEDGPPKIFKPILMGLITGCFSATVLIPSEVIKAKTQVEVGRMSSNEVLRTMLQRQGLKSLFIGFDSQLMRDGPFYASFFGGYELWCYFFKTYFPSMPNEVKYFMSGGLAGMVSWTLAMPLDVPKTNVQARYDTKVVGSYFPELFKIARKRGIRGLYSGLGPTVVRAFPANATMFLGIETSKELFDRHIWRQ